MSNLSEPQQQKFEEKCTLIFIAPQNKISNIRNRNSSRSHPYRIAHCISHRGPDLLYTLQPSHPDSSPVELVTPHLFTHNLVTATIRSKQRSGLAQIVLVAMVIQTKGWTLVDSLQSKLPTEAIHTVADGSQCLDLTKKNTQPSLISIKLARETSITFRIMEARSQNDMEQILIPSQKQP